MALQSERPTKSWADLPAKWPNEAEKAREAGVATSHEESFQK